MKLFLLLLALTIPFPATAEEDIPYLTCDDSVWILDGIERANMDESVKSEIRLEVIWATDPTCFES
jgi:hypothetical protein